MNGKIITVVGIGYIGLPLALAFASKKFKVYGYDISEERVKKVNEGNYGNVDTNLKNAKIIATNDPSKCMPESDYIIICVPTPLKENNEPDMSYIINATNTVSKHFKDGATIILESTTYPGTTEEILKPILKKSSKNFYLGYSPERIDPGNKEYPLEKIPKIISGIDKESLQKIEWLYSHIINDLVKVSNTKTAEAAKILENIFRAVNISLVNELALVFEKIKINTYEVIDAAKTKPFGFKAFYPGPGTGGHCIPVNPFYLSWKARQEGVESEFIELAGKISYKMVKHVIDLIKKNTKRDSKILILGVAYKKDISGAGNSSAKLIIENLDRTNIEYYDPFVPKFEGLESIELKNLNDYDCIVLLTDHSNFKKIDFSEFNGVLIDTRNFFNESKLNCKYVGLGK